MSSNRILSSVLTSTIAKGGHQVALSVATETQGWKRTEEIARAQGPGFQSAVLNDPAPLPPGTAELIQRETEHPSPGEKKDHWTAVARDKFHKYIKTIHVPKST